MIMKHRAGRSVRALEPGARLPEERAGATSRARLGTDPFATVFFGGQLETSSRAAGGRLDASLRRPPAAAARPDPARGLAPHLRLGPGAARAARRSRCSASARRPQLVEASTSSTGSTSRSTCSTVATSRRLARAATSARASRRTARSPTRSASASRRRSSSRSRRCSSRSAFGIPLGFIAAKKYGCAVRPREPGRVADRHLDPDLLPRLILQVHLRGAARLAAEHRPDDVAASTRSTRRTSTSSTRSSPRDWEALWDAIKHLILPAIALGSIPLAIVARITRASVLDVQNEDYVRTARAKGMSPRHRRPPARDAKRAPAGHDGDRPADRAPALGRDPHRDGLRLPGHRLVAVARRSSTATTRCSRAGSSSSRSSSSSSTCRRHLVRGDQPEDPVLVSVAELEVASSSQLERAEPGGLWRDAWSPPPAQPRRDRRLRPRLRLHLRRVFAPLIAPYDPLEQNLDAHRRTAAAPASSRDHWLGVDQLGPRRALADRLRRALSLLIGVVAVTVGLSIGLLLGVDRRALRRWRRLRSSCGCMDIMLAIPGLLLRDRRSSPCSGPGLFQVMIAVGVVQHPDLRAAATRLDPRAARERLRARRALGRRARAARSSSRTSFRTRSRR